MASAGQRFAIATGLVLVALAIVLLRIPLGAGSDDCGSTRRDSGARVDQDVRECEDAADRRLFGSVMLGLAGAICVGYGARPDVFKGRRSETAPIEPPIKPDPSFGRKLHRDWARDYAVVLVGAGVIGTPWALIIGKPVLPTLGFLALTLGCAGVMVIIMWSWRDK